MMSAMYYRSAVETAFERIGSSKHWKDPEAALQRALKARDEALDECFSFCKKNNLRVEDVLGLPL